MNFVIDSVDLSALQTVVKDMHMDPIYAQKVKKEIESKKLIFFAAKQNNKYIASVGLCVGGADEKEFRDLYPKMAVIYSLFVKPSYEGKGVGSALMDLAESEAKKHKKSGIVLGVVEENHRARALYERRGYEYISIGRAKTVKSHWDITNAEGKSEHTVVDVLPMLKLF